METIMRKIFFLIFAFFAFEIQGDEIIRGEFIKIYDNYYILHLPYEVGNDVEYVFVEDTALAIDIIEMRADGVILSSVFNYANDYKRNYFDIRETVEGMNEYFISMAWRLWYPRPFGAFQLKYLRKNIEWL